ncbi:MAG: hypothetical protein AABN34_23315 [Acidobacteriota bacterium]
MKVAACLLILCIAIAALALPLYRILSLRPVPTQTLSDPEQCDLSTLLKYQLVDNKCADNSCSKDRRCNLAGHGSLITNTNTQPFSITRDFSNLNEATTTTTYNVALTLTAMKLPTSTLSIASNGSACVNYTHLVTHLATEGGPEFTATLSSDSQRATSALPGLQWTGPTPQIFSITPSNVNANGATTLTVYGSNFQSGLAVSSVSLSSVSNANVGSGSYQIRIHPVGEGSTGSTVFTTQPALAAPTISEYCWDSTPTTGNQTFTCTITGTELVSGMQVFFSASGSSIYYTQPLVGLITTVIAEDLVDENDLGPCGTYSCFFAIGIQARGSLSQTGEEKGSESDSEALDFDRNLLTEPYATTQLISVHNINSSVGNRDTLARTLEASLYDSNFRYATFVHPPLRATHLPAIRHICRCGKHAGPKTPATEASNRVSASGCAGIDVGGHQCPSRFVVCNTTIYLPEDMGLVLT